MSRVLVDFKFEYYSPHTEEPIEVLEEWQNVLRTRLISCGYEPAPNTMLGTVTVKVDYENARMSIIQWVKEKLS